MPAAVDVGEDVEERWMSPILFGTAGATDVVWDVVPRRLLSATRSGAE